MATVKGMVVQYDVARRRLSTPVQSKHPRPILCGAWSSADWLALCSSNLVRAAA